MNGGRGQAHRRGSRALTLMLLAAFVFAGATLWNGCRPKAGALVEISEVVSSNAQSYMDKEYGTADWIELHNTGTTPLSLDGWFLTDKYDTLDADHSLPNITLPPDGYCLIFADKEKAREGRYCLPFGLSKAGESLYLFNAAGELVSQLQVPALEKDVSWALAQGGGYGYCLVPTPGKANTTEILAEMPTMRADGNRIGFHPSDISVRINEISSSSDASGSDWIELFNPTDEAVDVAGFCLTDSASDIMKGILPSLMVPAQGYLMVPLGADVDPERGIPEFSISSKGETIYFFDEGLGLVDMVDVPPLQEGTVFACGPEGVFGYCGIPTPGEANTAGIYTEPLRTMASDSPIHISEGLFRNRYSAIDAYGDHSDWVELVNRSQETVSLDGYYLSDRQDELRQWALPKVELGPGEYLLVFLSGRDERTGELHASFSVSDRDDGCILYDANTLEMECLPCPEGLRENVSVGFSEEGNLLYFGYPTPGQPNVSGFSSQEACGLPGGDVIISEVCAGGDDGDWIELYNRGAEVLDLEGWHLSDDEREPKKLMLTGPVLKAEGFHVVSLAEGAPFSISFSGERLVLTDENGTVRDVFATGALRQGMTSGRHEDDPVGERVFFASATKGEKNTAATVTGYAPAPRFSDITLYHDAPFELAMTADGEGTVIRYTLDGSAPTEQSTVYTQPLIIQESVTLRAASFSEGCFASEETVATFLFRSSHTLPVVCISADPKRWNQLTKVPFQTAGQGEQKAWFAYYQEDGTLGTAFPAGISPRGNASLSYPQKSLSIHLRGAYGRSSVAYPFWGGGSFLSYRFLVLRNGSQDSGSARLRDSFANRAAANLRVMTVCTKPVIVYVNGAYYGIMDLNEGMNQDYLWTHYGVDGSGVSIVQRNDFAKRGSSQEYLALRQFAKRKNMADNEVLAEFTRKVDVDAVIDYIIVQSFFGNYDIHNQNWWGSKDGTIRWQPILYDVDRCLNRSSLVSNVLGMYFNPNGVEYNRAGDRVFMEIPCGLKTNEAWRKRFVERYAELLCTELSESRLNALLDEMADALRPEMEEHIGRWAEPNSMRSWEKSIAEMHTCINERYKVVTEQIKQQFSVSDAEWKSLLKKYS